MQKVFLGVLASIAPPHLIAAARGILDFIYYAQYQSHTMEMLHRMQEAFKLFHANKDIFVNEGIHELSIFQNFTHTGDMATFLPRTKLKYCHEK